MDKLREFKNRLARIKKRKKIVKVKPEKAVEFDGKRYDSAGGYEIPPKLTETDAGKMTVADLQEIARVQGVKYSGLKKAELIKVLTYEPQPDS